MKNIRQGNKKKKKKDRSPNKKPHPKVKMAQWGPLKGKNTKLRT